jgi:hypothetical protein
MKISDYPKYIFWSYKDNCDVNEETIVNNVCLYGDIKDILKAYNEISKEKFTEVISKIQETKRYKKRINFIKKIIMEQK